MKRTTGILAAHLLGGAVALSGFVGGLTAYASAATVDPREAVASCVRGAPDRANPTIVTGCMRQNGYDPAQNGGAQAVECVDERFPGGDLEGCLDSLTSTAPTAAPSDAASGSATDQPAAVAAASTTAPPAAAAAGATVPPAFANPGAAGNPAAANAPAGSPATDANAGAPANANVVADATQEPATYVSTVPQGELPWWPLAVAFLLGAAMAAAITYFAIRTERERAGTDNALAADPASAAPLGVRIASPNDFSVLACDTPIALSANVVPASRASELTWTIAGPENKTIAMGTGPQFSFTASVTGVHHVVARLDQVADDLLLYVFKTPSGGTGLTDLLQAEPPPFPREPTSFVWNRSRTL